MEAGKQRPGINIEAGQVCKTAITGKAQPLTFQGDSVLA